MFDLEGKLKKDRKKKIPLIEGGNNRGGKVGDDLAWLIIYLGV